MTCKARSRVPALRLLWAGILFLSGTGANAATYYIRGDGGDAERCDGLSDRAWVRGDASRDCAWQHPFFALPPGGDARIAGGDTLFIRPGAYRMGLGAPGATQCSADFPWDCHLGALPSGLSSVQRTRVTGVDADGRCTVRPQLWGAERAARVLNLDRSSHIELSCLEITDHSSCVENHCHGGACTGEIARCERDTFPYGDWAGTGVFARDSSDAVLLDLDVHGLALRGFHVGRVRDWRLQRVAINGNGSAGWDGDLGEGGSDNAGRMQFVDVEIAWNGCAERYPGREPFGCWGQSSGGYGDGLGTAATAGRWSFEQTNVHHNSSDGLDLLYLRAPGEVSVTRSRFHANGGNQLKASGRVSVRASHIDGSCGELAARGGLSAADLCRAGGNSVSIGLAPNTTVQLEDNEIRGTGDCLVVVEGGDASSRVALRGNKLIGSPMQRDPGRRSCGFYSYRSRSQSELQDNAFVAVRNAQCPPGNRCSATQP